VGLLGKAVVVVGKGETGKGEKAGRGEGGVERKEGGTQLGQHALPRRARVGVECRCDPLPSLVHSARLVEAGRDLGALRGETTSPAEGLRVQPVPPLVLLHQPSLGVVYRVLFPPTVVPKLLEGLLTGERCDLARGTGRVAGGRRREGRAYGQARESVDGMESRLG
jgi:hypothetical protein